MMTAGANILVIDDEDNLRLTLSMILRSGGYSASLAGTGAEAWALINSQPFQLVFLDINLPDSNGIDLLKRIRENYPDMPVLMLTGNASLETSIQAIRQGARDYLLKPLDPAYILVRTKEILQETQQPARRREITRMMQGLMAELNHIDEGTQAGLAPVQELQALPPADPNRFLQVGQMTLDLHTRHCFLKGQFIPIPSSSFDYLVVLVRRSPNPVTFEALVSEAQGYRVSRAEASEMSRWQVHELRKAIEATAGQPSMIITVRNVGYRLAA